MRTRFFLSPSALRRVAAVLLGAVSPLLFAPWGRAQVQNVVANFRATLQRHENGRVRTQLTAGRAEFPPDGTIHAYDVELNVYTKDGDLEACLRSGEVRFDRDSREGHCPGEASFERHATHRGGDSAKPVGVSISGSDVKWLGDSAQLVIHSNAVVTIFREGKSLAEGWH